MTALPQKVTFPIFNTLFDCSSFPSTDDVICIPSFLTDANIIRLMKIHSVMTSSDSLKRHLLPLTGCFLFHLQRVRWNLGIEELDRSIEEFWELYCSKGISVWRERKLDRIITGMAFNTLGEKKDV